MTLDCSLPLKKKKKHFLVGKAGKAPGDGIKKATSERGTHQGTVQAILI